MAWVARGRHFLELRQCSGAAYPVLPTVELRVVCLFRIAFSTDASTLAVAAYPETLFISTTVSKMDRHRHLYSFRGIVHCEDQGWVVFTEDHVCCLDGPVLVEAEHRTPSHRIEFLAIVPRFGMVKVEKDRSGGHFVYLVACPDVVAMRGMGEARVGWMVAVARTALLFPALHNTTLPCTHGA